MSLWAEQRQQTYTCVHSDVTQEEEGGGILTVGGGGDIAPAVLHGLTALLLVYVFSWSRRTWDDAVVNAWCFKQSRARRKLGARTSRSCFVECRSLNCWFLFLLVSSWNFVLRSENFHQLLAHVIRLLLRAIVTLKILHWNTEDDKEWEPFWRKQRENCVNTTLAPNNDDDGRRLTRAVRFFVAHPQD